MNPPEIVGAENRGNRKGSKSEEEIGAYFRKQGWFVVRGAKLRTRGTDVTDVDLWMYRKTSDFSRARFIVDAKNRQKPQAMERILWAKGLQSSLSVEGAIVATTDARPQVREFADRCKVRILELSVVRAALELDPGSDDRMSEEEFRARLDPDGLGKMSDGLGQVVANARARLVTAPGFDAANLMLREFSSVATILQTTPVMREPALRSLYLITSYFLICTDSVLRELAFLAQPARVHTLTSGFEHGAGGEVRTEAVVKTAVRLIDAVFPGQPEIGQRARTAIADVGSSSRAQILGEFFARTDSTISPFDLARQFEAHAYSRSVVAPTSISTETRSVIGVLADYHALDRRALLLQGIE